MLTYDEVSTWFDSYNDMFGACGRGERPVTDVVEFYDEGVLITTSELVVGPGIAAATEWVDAQTRSMRAADYSHTEILSRDITILNANTALLRGDFSRRARDGEQVSGFTVTYLIYRSAGELHIGSLAIHSA